MSLISRIAGVQAGMGREMGGDPARASEYGMANLRRIVPRLVKWTTKPGEDYTDLEVLEGDGG